MIRAPFIQVSHSYGTQSVLDSDMGYIIERRSVI